MNRTVLFETSVATGRLGSKPFALWALITALAILMCTVVLLDASITTEQRIALFTQSGAFP